jgi:hypothetical protein
VPLDDRPDNVERVDYLARSLGYTLEMPESGLYATKLDGQPLNQNGTRYGDRAALYEWVLEQEKAGCHRYILSLDQLLSGGLVNSRAMQGENPVALADGTELTEAALLEELLKSLSADPRNTVWLLDSVMRLAPTTGYNGFGLNEYNALRTYGMAPRPALSGANLTVERVAADYALGTDGRLIACSSDTPLPEGAVRNYLASRERKLQLSAEAERILSGPGYENFHLLVGIDDSSAEDSIQKNEIALLRRGLRAGDALLSGVDDLGFKAVAKGYLQQYAWQPILVHTDYFGGTEDRAACDYDYRPLGELVDEHLDFFGMTRTDKRAEAELQVLVLTQPRDGNKAPSYWQALIAQLNENEKQQRPTILIDASNGAYGTAFHDALVKECDPGWLLGYSGFLDMAIVTGTALSHGISRYVWLQNGNGGDTEANAAFLRSLADSVLKDFCYKNTVRDDLIAYVRDDLGGNANNFCTPEVDASAVQAKLESGMAESTGAALKSFSHSNLIVSLRPYTLRGWGGLTLSDYSFPWRRAFEIRMTIQPEALTSPHKKLLFFYT